MKYKSMLLTSLLCTAIVHAEPIPNCIQIEESIQHQHIEAVQTLTDYLNYLGDPLNIPDDHIQKICFTDDFSLIQNHILILKDRKNLTYFLSQVQEDLGSFEAIVCDQILGENKCLILFELHTLKRGTIHMLMHLEFNGFKIHEIRLFTFLADR